MQLKSFYNLNHLLENRETILIEEQNSSAKANIVSYTQKTIGKNILILTGQTTRDMHLFHDLSFFTDRDILEFPAWETMPSDHIAPSPDIVGSRYLVLNSILQHNDSSIIVSNIQAVLQKLISPKNFQKRFLNIKTGDDLSFEKLIEALTDMGYLKCPKTCDKGEFSVRGGIIDIFPVSEPEPYRLEFFGDCIESIRTFDPIGQKTVEIIKEAKISAALEMEMLSAEQKLSTILDYLGKDTIIVFDDLLTLEDSYCKLTAILKKPSKLFCSLDEFFKKISSLQKIYFTNEQIEHLSQIKYSKNTIAFQMFNRELKASLWASPFIPIANFLLPEKEFDEPISQDELLLSLDKLSKDDYSLNFICQTEAEKTNLRKNLLSLNASLPKKTEYQLGYLTQGFVLAESKTVLFPMTEITKNYKIRRQKLRSAYHTAQPDIYHLTKGEMVVHLNNGIGKFLGLEKMPNNLGAESEFFIIEYADRAKLYVPINQAHLISKYIGSNEQIPKMHTIGAKAWKKIREKTDLAIFRYANEILELTAKRELKGGFAYSSDSPEILSFEEEFPFTETEDQLQAIKCIKDDMQSEKAMDRLICGDVGYGKTELALRAAFKAVVDGQKQVAMLVPTTVLAMQHFETFLERMQNFPINIALLSRFGTGKETKITLEKIARGSVDIVIGTHRLISKDVYFKNLGLIIIDEEQRFGVKAKDHLKKIKIGVDCITLSATPIPRTLYLSLVGAKDMSIINTPPQDRLPIKTIISEPDEKLIKNALQRELARDGQAYVIHNRVETIHTFAKKIQKLVPKAKIGVAHGQMHAKDIDRVFHQFKNGNIDILAATSIVENGLDIPNANTIIIDKADYFGLADLYQLRGRVGRWNKKAYAYFLIPKFRILPEITQKRLQALAESSGYGGGMKLAMRDLEIRGAGNILGLEQSGHVTAIGFHLYCKLLQKTIKTINGQIPKNLTETEIEIPQDCHIPESYISESSLRMEIYQRIGDAITKDEIDDIFNELKDRFGPMPEEMLWLYYLLRVKVVAQINSYTLLKLNKYTLYTEKKRGSETITNKHLIGKIKTPKDLEDQLVGILTTGSL